jgi:hypothetical protein
MIGIGCAKGRCRDVGSSIQRSARFRLAESNTVPHEPKMGTNRASAEAPDLLRSHKLVIWGERKIQQIAISRF